MLRGGLEFMRSGTIWAIWMGLALAGSIGPHARAQSGQEFPDKGPARLPLRELPADVREAVRQVLLHPILYLHGPPGPLPMALRPSGPGRSRLAPPRITVHRDRR